MANTFLAAKGCNMQKSLVEDDKLALARTLLEKADAAGVDLLLPSDVVCGAGLEAPADEELDQRFPEPEQLLEYAALNLV